MRRVESPQGKWWNVVFFLTALLVVAADQLAKELWIRSYPQEQPIFEAGFFRIIYTENTGAAFGLFPDQFLALTVVAFVGIVLILLFVFLVSRYFPFLDNRWGRLALGLVLGGTIGNLTDRLRFCYVTDFIDIGVWPAFNIADSAITIGVILFAYFFLTSTRDKKLFQPKVPEQKT